MQKVIFSFLCISYFFVLLGSNSIFFDNYVALNQFIRHFSSFLFFCLSIVYFLKQNIVIIYTKIFILLTFICFSSFLIDLIIIVPNEIYTFKSLYNCFEPIISIGFSISLGYLITDKSNYKILVYSFIFAFISYIFINIINSELLFSPHYNRPRLILGFKHPGKLAQHLTLLYIFLQLYKTSSKYYLVKYLKLSFSTILLLMIILTNTRAMFVILLIFHFFKIISVFKPNDSKKLTISLMLVLIPLSIISINLLSDDLLRFIFSGRLSLWLATLLLNLEHYGTEMFFLGALGDPLIFYERFIPEIHEKIQYSFRIDNGYLETFLNHGFFVTLGYFIVVINFFQKSPKNNINTSLLLIFLFFIFGESGFLSVGNSFNIFILAILIQRTIIFKQGIIIKNLKK